MSQQQSGNPYTRGMAEFVAGLTYDAIPADVIQRVKLLMLDALGCGIYGARLEWSRILQNMLRGIDSTRTCRVWGTNQRLSAPHSTLVNGTQVQGFELDDGHHRGHIHVGSVVLPALMAVIETKPGISGREFLAAAVAGYETGPRVGNCMNPEHIAQGWHSAATVGVFSAASAAARALKLDADKTVHALGIAGTQAAGLMAAQYGAMVKRMHAGRASQSGLYGALLAEQGFTGITSVFESEYGGFCTTFSRSQDRFKIKELTAGLGSEWETFNTSLKFYSCVFSNHNALDALRVIQRERPFKAADVEKVVIHGAQITVDHVGWKYKPEGMTSAQLNMPFCVATLILEGDVFVDQFNDDSVITDPARMALADKVEVINDPAITAAGAKERFTLRVQVFFKDGTMIERTGKTERANKNNFATEQVVVDKFDKLTRHALPQKQRDELRDAVLGLEKLDDAGKLAGLLGVA